MPSRGKAARRNGIFESQSSSAADLAVLAGARCLDGQEKDYRMKNFSILAAASLALAAATPAHAGVNLDADGAGAIPAVSLNNGNSTTIYFDGFGA